MDDVTPSADRHDPGPDGPSRHRPGPGLAGRRLPTRGDVLGAVSRVLWPVRSARAQREAGHASAAHAVHIGAAHADAPDATADPAAGLPADHHEPFAADPGAAAFFDVDNTLIQGASILLLARGLAKHRFFTTRDAAGMAWTQIKFRGSGTENPEDVASGREKALGFVKGRRVAEIVELSEEVFDASMVDRIWPGSRALAQMHLDAGHQVWLVTATPVELARVIAERLGLTGALGTVAESSGGVYTGRLVGDILHGEGKAHAVQALAEAQGFDLERCYAYSDSHNDVPMLSLVGNAVAINPDSRLREVARERGWEVKDFRTVRKAALKAMPGVVAVGALGGATAAARTDRGSQAVRRARRALRHLR